MGGPMPGMPPVVFQSEDEDASFDLLGVLNRRKWLVFLGLITGLTIGVLIYSKSETIFESSAVISIEPKQKPIVNSNQSQSFAPTVQEDVAHEKLIGQRLMVRNCITSEELHNLKTFDGIAEDEIVDEILNNLSVTSDREAPYIYSIVFKGPDSSDTEYIVNKLVSTYSTHLDRKYQFRKSEFKKSLQHYINTFDRNYKVVQAEIEDLEEQYNALPMQGGGSIYERLVVENSNQILAATNQLRDCLLYTSPSPRDRG